MEKLPSELVEEAVALIPAKKKAVLAEARQSLKTYWQYGSKTARLIGAIGTGAYMIVSNRTYKDPNNFKYAPKVSHFCKLVADAFNIEVTVHGEMPRTQALWVSNHISWMDIPVVGSKAWVFFLAKAEMEHWPVMGFLAKGGGTLFIKRGSGDGNAVKDQMAAILKRHIPVLFFPEATTTDGRSVKKLYGKLLGSALETGTPIQPVVLCYVDEQGKLDMQAPFIDDDSLDEHIGIIIRRDKINAHLMPLEAISPQGHSLESLTELLHERMREGLSRLHQLVLH